MAEFRLTPAAEKDLESIWTYTYKNWDRDQANRYVDELVSSFEHLATNPQLAPDCGHIKKGYRRWPVESHIVYYQEIDYGILVVRVLHERIHALSHLRN